MSFTVTHRASAGSSAAVANKTAPTFTPSANARLLAFAWAQGSSAADTALTFSDTSGITWTQVGQSGTVGAFFGNGTLWTATTGASPANCSITFSSGGSADIGYVIIDVTRSDGA